MTRGIAVIFISALMMSCGSGNGKKATRGEQANPMENNNMVRLITVEPGHFHAALVQKNMYPRISPDVYVYASDGPDLQLHLDRIEAYNTRAEQPTNWHEIVYKGEDFFGRMLSEKPGNVVILSGNNRKKAEYLTRSIEAGLNVLADKPMIIDPADFSTLESAFKSAEENGVLLYDIMTERYEITTILQKLLSREESVFGKLQSGSESNPAVSKISVHHFSKIVSGVPLQRPAWYFDVEQQGEGIVDVTTHLVDLVQWECFPEQVLDPADVKIVSAKRWPTMITREQFKGVTGYEDFPGYLEKDIKNGVLNVFANGEITYQLKDIWAKVSVTWDYMPPAGGGDTHYSVMRGSLCDLVIRQEATEKFVPTLYVENIREESRDKFITHLNAILEKLPYEGVRAESLEEGRVRINIPDKYRVSHEEHFGQVTEKYLEYLSEGRLPEWEVPGMITKYYTTTTALKKAREQK